MVYNNKETLTNQRLFYRAVIEDRNDPEKLNRVRVRIMGIHSKDAVKVPKDNLPWAEIAPGIISGGQNSGIGISTVPLLGTWVWVFLDNGDWNRPIVIASMYGIPTLAAIGPTPEGGFTDPEVKYPLSNRLSEPDTNRLARSIIDDTLILTVKTAKQDKGIVTVTGQVWDEPAEHSSAAVYPDNTVIETISGNIIEYDDTPGNSRIHFFHRSGTYFEMVDNGDFISKTSNESYTVKNKNHRVLVKMSEFRTIRNNFELKIDGNEHEAIGGNSARTVKGTQTETVTGAVKETYSAGLSTNGGPSITFKAGTINFNP